MRGHGAFLHDKFRSVSLSGNQASHIINCGEVGLAIFFWRRADANEDSIAGVHCCRGVTGKRKAICAAVGGQQAVQMGLVDGYDASLQCCDAFRVVVRAYDLVSCLSKTCPGNQSHVSTTDDCNSQFRTSHPHRDERAELQSSTDLGSQLLVPTNKS